MGSSIADNSTLVILRHKEKEEKINGRHEFHHALAISVVMKLQQAILVSNNLSDNYC